LNRGRPCCVDGWNLAARKARGEILIQCSDDLHPPPRWDVAIREKLGMGERAAVLAVSDGLTARLDFLPHAIVTRRYYGELGYLFHDGYWSMFSDNEFSRVAHARKVVVDGLDIAFTHTNGQIHDDVRARHERPHFDGSGKWSYDVRAQGGFQPWVLAGYASEDGDSDGLYSPNWYARLPPYWNVSARGEAHDLSLHADSLARRTRTFGPQAPVSALQVLIATVPQRRPFVDLLSAELVRQRISFLLDERPEIPLEQKRRQLLARATGDYVTFIDDGDWVSHNYGELIGDAIANNHGQVDLVLHDALTTRGDETPRPVFFSLDPPGAEPAECRLRGPDRSMVWKREVARRGFFGLADVRRWARVRGLLRFEETPSTQ
jgi:hypothetical protein